MWISDVRMQILAIYGTLATHRVGVTQNFSPTKVKRFCSRYHRFEALQNVMMFPSETEQRAT